MGWWTIRKDEKEPYNASKASTPGDDSQLLEIGDQPMDAIDSALKKVVRIYKKDLKRKPTPDEIAELIESSVKILEEDLFDNMEEREVGSISIVLKHRTKRPKPKPGDLFAIPLISGGYGYGRIMKLTLRTILWMKLLNICTDHIIEPDGLRSAKTILDINTSSRKIDSVEWPIIGHLPLSDEDQEALMHEPYWIMGYSVNSAEEIADWKLSGKQGLPPDFGAPYVGYKDS